MKRLPRLASCTLLLIASLLLSACAGTAVLNALSPAKVYTLHRDQAFGSHGMRLDVYEPSTGTPPRAVIVFLYGGSWQRKSTLPKEEYRFVGAALAARGYVVVIPDYRLYPDVRFPAFLDDCAEAVVWAHANAGRFGADASRLVLAGHSAGAYNAAMVSLDGRYLERAGGSRGWIKALVGLAGPYDFLPLEDRGLKALFAPAEPLSTSQPIHHVDSGAPPTLLLAGANDSAVYAKNTENFAATLRDHGNTVEEYVYPSMSHTKIIATVATPLQGFSDVADRIDRFVMAKTRSSKSDE